MVKIKYVERLKGGDNFVRLFIEIGKKIMFKLGIKIVIIEVDNVKRLKNVIYFRIISYWNFRIIFFFIVYVVIVCFFLKI